MGPGADRHASQLATPERLATLRQLSYLTDSYNEGIRSREAFRLNNRALQNLANTLKAYDGILLSQGENLLALLRDFQPILPERPNP